MKIDANRVKCEVKGNWGEIVDLCEDINDLLEENNKENISEKWNKWRPRENDDIDDEMENKTIEHQSLDHDSNGRTGDIFDYIVQVEKKIYSFIVTFNPLYFNTEEFNAELKERDKYELSIYSNNKEIKKCIKNRCEERS